MTIQAGATSIITMDKVGTVGSMAHDLGQKYLS